MSEDSKKSNEKSEFICSNKWCKCKYTIEKDRYYNDNMKTCDKCRSFDNEISGGVSYNSKSYSGERFDNKPHQTEFKFSDYFKGKWGKKWSK